MITTTCLIGVLVGALTSVRPARLAWVGEAVAAAAVSTLAASPATAATLTRLISFSFTGLPSPSVRELSGCRETAVKKLRVSLSMKSVIVREGNKR